MFNAGADFLKYKCTPPNAMAPAIMIATKTIIGAKPLWFIKLIITNRISAIRQQKADGLLGCRIGWQDLEERRLSDDYFRWGYRRGRIVHAT